MRTVEVDIDGQPVKGLVENVRGVLWVHLNGRIFTYEPPVRASGRKGGRHGAPKHVGDIVAPMPGKVIKIEVSPGETVAEGQVLVVLEAMKMEYTLKAQAAGTVETVNCKAGDQVALGQLLVKLKSATDGTD